MNGSTVTASTAGMESTAKRRSVVSIATRTTQSGVASEQAVPLGKKCGPWMSGVTGNEAAEELDQRVRRRVEFRRVVVHHLDAAVDEDEREDVDDPVEFIDQRDAREDEDRSHDQSAEDARRQQHAMLVLRGHAEVLEEHREDEDVVHAERDFHEVTRQELDACLMLRIGSVVPADQTEVDQCVET